MFVQFGRKIWLNQTLKRSIIFTDKLCTNFQLIGYVRLVRFEKLLVLLHITEKRKHVVLNFLRKDLVLSSLRPEMMNYSVFVFDISSVENIHEISSFREYISIHYEGKVRWNKISYVDFIQPCSIRAVCIMWMDCITRMRPFPLPPPCRFIPFKDDRFALTLNKLGQIAQVDNIRGKQRNKWRQLPQGCINMLLLFPKQWPPLYSYREPRQTFYNQFVTTSNTLWLHFGWTPETHA